MAGQKQQRGIVQRWLMVLAVVAILAGGYYYFIVRTPAIDFGNTQASVDRVPGQQNIVLLRELRNLNLSNELFRSEVFKSLFDTRVEVGTEPVGRSNPFAPVGQN